MKARFIHISLIVTLLITNSQLVFSQGCAKTYAQAKKLYDDHKADKALDLVVKACNNCLGDVNVADSVKFDLLMLRAELYYDHKDYKTAIKHYSKAHHIVKNSDLTYRIDKSLRFIGDSFRKLDKWDSAGLFYSKSLSYYDNGSLKKMSKTYASLLYRFGQVKSELNEYKHSKELLSEALAYYDTLKITDSEKYDVLDALTSVLIELDEWETANLYQEKQSTILKLLCDKASKDTKYCAVAYYNIGLNYDRISESKKAIECMEKALPLYIGLKGDYKEQTANCYEIIGESYSDLKDWKNAEINFATAVEFAKQSKVEETIASLYYHFAASYLAQSKTELAEKYANESQSIYKSIDPESEDVRNSYLQFAKIAEAEKEEVRQEGYLQQYKALALKHNNGQYKHAEACYLLGTTYKSSGQYLKAEKELLESCEIHYKLYPDGMNFESSLAELADLYRITDRYNKADSAYDICVELYEKNKQIGVDYGNVFYFKSLNYQSKGDFVSAVVSIEKSLDVIIKKEGISKDYAENLKQMGDVYRANGDYQKASQVYSKSLKLSDSLKLTGNKIICLRSLGGLYFDWGKKDQAFHFKRQALQLAKEAALSDMSIADAQFELGALHRLVFQFDSAVYYYLQVEKTYKNKAGVKSTTYASILGQLASTYYYLGAIDSTENLRLRALSIYKSINPNSLDYANALFWLGSFYSDVDRIKEAEKYFRDGIKLQENLTGPTLALAGKLGPIGWFYMNLANFNEAEIYYKKAMSMVEAINGKDCIAYGFRLNELGVLYKLKGSYAKSEEYLLAFLKIEGKKRGVNSSGYGISLNNLGTLYGTMGLDQKALQCYQQAAQIMGTIFGKESEDYAFYLNNLAGAYRDLKNYKRADSLYSIVLTVRKKYFGPNHPKTINTISNLAAFEMLTGAYQKSALSYANVIDYRTKVFGSESLNTLYPKEGKAELLTTMGKYQESNQLLLPIVAIYKKNLGENHPTYAGLNKKLGINAIGLHDYKQATPFLKTTLAIRFSQVDKIFSSLTEREREDFYKNMKSDFDVFNSYSLIGAGKIDFLGKKNAVPDFTLLQDLYNNQIATKALLLSSTARLRKQIISGSDKVLKEKFFEWEKLKSQLASLYQKSSADTDVKGEQSPKNKIARDSLEEKIDKLERELSSKSEKFAKKEDKKKYTWQDVQAKLKPGEAAIEIIRMQKYGLKEWITDDSDPKKTRYPKIDLTDTVLYAALIVTLETKTAPELVLFTDGNNMESRQMKSYQNNIYQRQVDGESYNRFWRPIASNPAIQGKVKKIYFSPDGIYNQVSLNSLQNPETKKYLIDEVDIQLVTNTKDILIAKQSNEANYYGMFIGNPSFYVSKKSVAPKEGVRSYSLTRGGSLASLPGAEHEVDVIRQLMDSTSSDWEKSDLLKGKDATESKLKNMENPRVLHIATHGFFEQSQSAQGTRGAQIEVEESKVQESTGNRLNPMLASGLFLQGGGDALAKLKTFDYELLDREDGILTAYEAMNLNIENTDLVVLSACETGLGEVNNGEGVYGLQRALKVAGANSIVMSLWSVSDDATMILMKEFYKGWLKTGDKAESFKKAQLAVRANKRFDHPFFWSAFVLVGN